MYRFNLYHEIEEREYREITGTEARCLERGRENRGEVCMHRAIKGIRTKRKLADALAELLETGPLERIRVHHLTDRCEIHRQTFYYHFADVYALFAWSIREEGAALSARLEAAPDWREALELLLGAIPPRQGWFLAVLNQADPAARQAFFEGLLVPVAKKAGTADPGGVSAILLSLLEKWIRDGCVPAPEGMAVLLERMENAGSAG